MGRLPFPAHNLAPEVVPADRVPQPRPAAGPFAPNTALCGATRLFEGRVVGSESVAVAPDGTLWMLDKWGVAHTAEALEGAAGGAGDSADSGAEGVVSGAGALRYRLHPQPAAYVGPGRPLGFHFDAAGNLAICDSLKVMAGTVECTRPRRMQGGTSPLVLMNTRAFSPTFTCTRCRASCCWSAPAAAGRAPAAASQTRRARRGGACAAYPTGRLDGL
mgnify:CR=1 FL=1